VTVVLLSEIIFNKLKIKSMKETIIKIGIHLMVSSFLIGLESWIVQIAGLQAHPLDRFCGN
jgi:hypothetical protein